MHWRITYQLYDRIQGIWYTSIRQTGFRLWKMDDCHASRIFLFLSIGPNNINNINSIQSKYECYVMLYYVITFGTATKKTKKTVEITCDGDGDSYTFMSNRQLPTIYDGNCVYRDRQQSDHYKKGILQRENKLRPNIISTRGLGDDDYIVKWYTVYQLLLRRRERRTGRQTHGRKIRFAGTNDMLSRDGLFYRGCQLTVSSLQ